jgi:hypothetical protein
MSQRERRQDASLTVSDDQPLIGVVLFQDGRETVHYYCREEDAQEEISPSATKDALALAGAWSDLNWEELEQGLDLIRHQSPPTPPISV